MTHTAPTTFGRKSCSLRTVIRLTFGVRAFLIWIMKVEQSWLRVMMDELSRRLEPDELWSLVEPLIP